MELVHEFTVAVPVRPGGHGDVSARLLDQFVHNLEADVLSPATDA
jgi:hypothetical protein